MFKFQDENIKTPNKKLTELINQLLERENFKGKFGETFIIYKASLPKKFSFNKILILGCGERKDFSIEKIRKLGSIISKNASVYNYSSAFILSNLLNKNLDKKLSLKALLEGIMLGEYKFDKFLSKKDEDNLKKLEQHKNRKT